MEDGKEAPKRRRGGGADGEASGLVARGGKLAGRCLLLIPTWAPRYLRLVAETRQGERGWLCLRPARSKRPAGRRCLRQPRRCLSPQLATRPKATGFHGRSIHSCPSQHQ